MTQLEKTALLEQKVNLLAEVEKINAKLRARALDEFQTKRNLYIGTKVKYGYFKKEYTVSQIVLGVYYNDFNVQYILITAVDGRHRVEVPWHSIDQLEII